MEDECPVNIIYLEDDDLVIKGVNRLFRGELVKMNVNPDSIINTPITRYIPSHLSVNDIRQVYRSLMNITFNDGNTKVSVLASYYDNKLFLEINICGGGLVRFLSHELKTPIMTNVELSILLEMSGLNANQMEILNMMKTNSLVFTRTLNNTMDYLKSFSDDGSNIKKTEFTLSTLTNNLREIVIDRDGVNIRYPRDTNASVNIRSDYNMVLYILKTIITHCLDFENVSFITMSVVIADVPDAVVVNFFILDDGDALSDHQKNMIDGGMLYISDDDINHKKYSSGFGMVVVKRMSVLLGGGIEITRTPSGYNSYKFYFT
jgi:K+-sensing histidine kinase KdpD